MTKKRKISVFQLYTVFFVCRVTALFTYISPQRTAFEPGDRLVMFIPFCLIEAAFAVPVFLVTKNGGTLTKTARSVSPRLAKLTAVVYAAGFIWNAGISTARFELFMGTVMFSGAVILPFTALMLLACVYIATKGMETTGRCCTAVFAVLVLSLIAAAAAVAKDFDPANLTAPFADGFLSASENAFFAAARTPELSSLLFILPEVNGKVKKGFFIWAPVFGLTASAALGLIAGVTGKYGDSQMFQLYTVTVLAEFGAFKQTDDLLTGLWVLCSLFRTSFYLLVTAKTLSGAFGEKNRNAIFVISALCIFGLCAALSHSVSDFALLLSSGINEILYTTLTGIVPLLIFLISVLKKKSSSSNRAGDFLNS